MDFVTHKILPTKGFNVELKHNWLRGHYTVLLDGKVVYEHRALLDTGLDYAVYTPSGTFVCRVQAHYSWLLWRSWCYSTCNDLPEAGGWGCNGRAFYGISKSPRNGADVVQAQVRTVAAQ